MIKKLDSLILRSFVGPFIATFLISLFVLVMQFFWLYIDDFVGKGLDLLTVGKMIGLVAATVLPLALPLSLLLSSIMTFGNLGESFELVAIKSSGIPLTRFMRPILVVALLFSGVQFIFCNNIIPVANLKLGTLKTDIIVSKPAFDLKAGTFYDKIPGYVIKLGKKDEDNKTIHDVVIFVKNYGLQDNLIIAKSGEMVVSPDHTKLQFILKNGWNYEETGNSTGVNTQFTRMGFGEYHKDFDLTSFQLQNSDENQYKRDPKMMSIHQLNPAIDSIKKEELAFDKRSKKELLSYLPMYQYQDTTWKKIAPSQKILSTQATDSMLQMANNSVVARFGSMQSTALIISNDFQARQDDIVKHKIEWHRKFTLSAACILLFMIGAPLGSIIRKGGLGTPLLFAIIFFVIFYLFNTIGEKMAKQHVVSPFIGMWLSSFVLLPIAIFLTSKAMKDSQLFSNEFWFRIGKWIHKKIVALKAKKQVSSSAS